MDRDELMTLVEARVLDPTEVLKNLLFNYMSVDEANDFAKTEYSV